MSTPIVVVTGANGLVGSHVVSALSDRGATVRAVVRRAGAAPDLPGVEEHVGDFADPAFAGTVVAGADAVVTTVHPLGSGREDQRRVGLDGTVTIAEASVTAGVPLLVHVSTAGVYDRSPEVGDVTEAGALVPDDSSAYGVVKRDVDAALERISGITRVLLRPPAILGAGDSSVWNTVRPAQVRDDESERHANPDQSFAWVHVSDLASLAADLATGRMAPADDVARGPLAGGCTPVNVAAGPATQRDYLGALGEALGFEPTWDDGPAWTGRIVADRAAGWGWTPRVGLDAALDELRAGLR
ncbi:nucleoside-diphosphate-sugar epimerase [Nocardioides cavernae]|uniref:Nucleoside-diphosphate-sugar epimerase n=1 Tax=Nocardioides cavernae TaxID=1921566 RepID=A0A7Y9KSN5_9ACTN|nr:NAD(P)-dependent oxidoreductase [Nocardioides cavernae]NYE36702.1 nucleoside-diphosphate-sugar epimerase [Nocardioides cavernae]